jgi:pSer/pThr/pTyr-binding forkhead associated (FHA) protein
MIKLVVKAQLTEGGTKDYSYEFEQPVVTIGRLKENDIQLPSSTVSGYHAQILKEGDNYYLADRGSINGSYLNGQRLVPGEKKLLSDSDLIKIQNFEIYFSTGINVLNVESGATVQVARQMVMEVLGSWQATTSDKPRVILMGGNDAGKQFELSEGTNLTAGRTAGVDIVIEHPSVSRRHAEISLSWSGAFIKDLNSANGTFVNDERISGSKRLRDRDEIRFGQQSSSAPVILVFSNPAEALLSKLEEMQMTDSQPGVLQSKEVTDAAAQEGEKIAAEEAATASAEGEVEAEQEAAAEAEQDEAAAEEEQAEAPPIVDESIDAPQPQGLRRIFSSPLGLIGIIAIVLVVIGIAVIIIPPIDPTIGDSAKPDKGSTGDIIRIAGDFEPEDVTSVKILEKDAFVLKRDDDGIEIKLPDFPEISAAETKAEFTVLDDEKILTRIPFTILIAPRIQNINPLSGGVGTQVRIQTNMPGQATTVFFGKDLAGGRIDGQDVVVTVPSPGDNIPENGIKVPITVKINNLQARNSIDFLILPETVPLEVFKLGFVAKPYSTILGFNEYSIETNLGPLLILVAKDDSVSSRDRAETVAKNLNDGVQYFQSNPDAKITFAKEEDAYSIFADGAVEGTRLSLLRVLRDDTLPYSKLNSRVVSLDELAEWWRMLLGAYYKTFVQAKNPEGTGILASGGGIFQQVVNFYAVGNEKGEKYYPNDFLEKLPVDQKSKLISMSLTLPTKVANVDGSWVGAMDNKLYSNISDPTLQLELNLKQRGEGISGRAIVTWKIVMGSTSGSFQNEAYKPLGTFSLFGQYRKTSTFPVEFTFTEKDGRALDFVGKLDGRSLKGTYVIRATGQEGSWQAILAK